MSDDSARAVALQEKAKKLARWISESRHAVVYTGAGISTAAGIPDYRGPQGVWALRAKGLSLPEPNFFQVEPTLSHLALAALVQRGLVRHVVTQNIDGLHRRSGIPDHCLSELHGNFSLERCSACGAQYHRDYPVWHGLTSYAAPAGLLLSPCSSAPDLAPHALHHPGAGAPLCSSESLSSEGSGWGEGGGGGQRKRQCVGLPRRASSSCFSVPEHAGEFPPATSKLSHDGFVMRSCRQRYESARKVKQAGGAPSPGSSRSDCQGSGTRPAWSGPSPRGGTVVSASLSDGSSSSSVDGPSPHTPPLDTGRHCDRPECMASLHRSVVLFGENLCDEALANTMDNSEAADLAIVIGSSLSVGPACEFPAGVLRRGGRMVIINLQPTQYDKRASMVVRERCDDILALVAEELCLSIEASDEVTSTSPAPSPSPSPSQAPHAAARHKAQVQGTAGEHDGEGVKLEGGELPAAAEVCLSEGEGSKGGIRATWRSGAVQQAPWDPRTPPRVNRTKERKAALELSSEADSGADSHAVKVLAVGEESRCPPRRNSNSNSNSNSDLVREGVRALKDAASRATGMDTSASGCLLDAMDYGARGESEGQAPTVCLREELALGLSFASVPGEGPLGLDGAVEELETLVERGRQHKAGGEQGEGASLQAWSRRRGRTGWGKRRRLHLLSFTQLLDLGGAGEGEAEVPLRGKGLRGAAAAAEQSGEESGDLGGGGLSCGGYEQPMEGEGGDARCRGGTCSDEGDSLEVNGGSSNSSSSGDEADEAEGGTGDSEDEDSSDDGSTEGEEEEEEGDGDEDDPEWDTDEE